MFTPLIVHSHKRKSTNDFWHNAAIATLQLIHLLPHKTVTYNYRILHKGDPVILILNQDAIYAL